VNLPIQFLIEPGLTIRVAAWFAEGFCGVTDGGGPIGIGLPVS